MSIEGFDLLTLLTSVWHSEEYKTMLFDYIDSLNKCYPQFELWGCESKFKHPKPKPGKLKQFQSPEKT